MLFAEPMIHLILCTFGPWMDSQTLVRKSRNSDLMILWLFFSPLTFCFYISTDNFETAFPTEGKIFISKYDVSFPSTLISSNILQRSNGKSKQRHAQNVFEHPVQNYRNISRFGLPSSMMPRSHRDDASSVIWKQIVLNQLTGSSFAAIKVWDFWKRVFGRRVIEKLCKTI